MLDERAYDEKEGGKRLVLLVCSATRTGQQHNLTVLQTKWKKEKTCKGLQASVCAAHLRWLIWGQVILAQSDVTQRSPKTKGFRSVSIKNIGVVRAEISSKTAALGCT